MYIERERDIYIYIYIYICICIYIYIHIERDIAYPQAPQALGKSIAPKLAESTAFIEYVYVMPLYNI